MSKCSVTKCQVYTSEGQMLELNNGVFAWVPLCAKHKAEWVSNGDELQANDTPHSKLAQPAPKKPNKEGK